MATDGHPAGDAPVNTPNNESPQFGRDKSHKDSSVDIFRTCADPGRKESLKALEIPMEHLLSGIIILPGGRSQEGCPILELTQPNTVEEALVRQITHDTIIEMLIYYTSVPREEARAKGFCVIMDGIVMADFMQITMMKAMNQFHHDTGYLTSILYLSSSAMPDWTVKCGETITLPLTYVSSYDGLLEYADKSQLMPDLGGYLEYVHQDWVKFRMQVEPFLCDCVTISKRLAQAIAPFSRDLTPPKNPEETQEVLKKHQLKKRRTIDQLQIDQLTSEGLKINRLIRQESEERRSSICSNPEFLSTIATVSTLLANIEAVKGRVEGMWLTRGEKLEATYKQQTFEQEANQIIEWFQQYTDGVYQTHSELGESQQVAETLAKEVTDFETATQQILVRTEKLLQSGTILETLKHTDHETIQILMGKIKQLMTDFDDRLGKRKKKIDESVQLHKLTETALDWCIESAGILSGFDLLSSSSDFDPAAAIVDIDRFLDENPPPSAESQQDLVDLAEVTENHWAKQNALFAYNRVMEISERFSYQSQLLENMASSGQRGGAARPLTGVGLARIPVSSGTSTAELEEKLRQDGGAKNGETRIDGPPNGVPGGVMHIESDVSDDDEQTDAAGAIYKSLRSTRASKKQTEAKKKLHLSTEMLDLDEALTFLSDVANGPDTVNPATVPTPRTWKTSTAPSPEPPHQRVSKADISGPTQTMGPLFNLDSPTAGDDTRRFSLPNVDEDLAAQTKNAKHRRFLMQELIETEKAYIAHLEKVVDTYMPAMDHIEDMPRVIVGKKNIIFANVQQLLEFNRQIILPRLEQCRKFPIKLGEMFISEEEDFLNYSKYFKNMPHQTHLMKDGGIAFFADVQRRLEDTFDLSSYLIKPFQRITKYKLFLADMIKHSSTTDHKGKLKEYFDQLKEAHKMIDFILRHGNDMLAVESMKGFEGNLREQGKILRQGDLVVYERHHKHKRRVFLFENTIILAKTKRPKHQPDISGSEVYEFKSAYKTSDYTLYENIPGHPTRFELRKKRDSLMFQAETDEEKSCWTQDVWDLYFSHMLQLKDQTLEAYGSRALTSVVTSGVATLTRGRPLGHSMRRSLRYSQGTPRNSQTELRRRPPSEISIGSTGSTDEPIILRQRAGTYSPTPSSNRLSGTFLELKSNRVSVGSLDECSDRSSVSSSSTLTSISLSSSDHSPVVSSPQQTTKRQSQLALEVRRADRNSKTDMPLLPPEVSVLEPSPISSSTSSQDTTEETSILGGDSTSAAAYETPV